MDQINVQIRFTVHDDATGLDFSDAIYYPIADWPIPDERVEMDKQARFVEWKAATQDQQEV